MKQLFLLTLAALLFGWCGAYAQPELHVVWEKMIWPTEIKFAKFSKDGQWIYCAINNTIVKMNPQTGDFVSTFNNTGVSNIYDMDISLNGNIIVTHDNTSAHFWSLDSEKVSKQIDFIYNEIEESVEEFAISPDEKILVCATWMYFPTTPHSYARHLILYDIEKDSVVKRLQTELRASHIRFSNDGKTFAIGGTIDKENPDYTRNYLKLFNTETFEEIATLEDENSDNEYVKFQFSNDGKYLGSLKQWNFKLFDLDTKEIKFFSGTARGCHGFGIYPDTDYMLLDFSRSDSSFVELYDIPENNQLKRMTILGAGYIIEIFKFDDNSILTYVGNGIVHRVFSNKPTSIIGETIPFEIIVNSSSIGISGNELISEIKVIGTIGNTIYSIANVENYFFSLPHSFSSGTYIILIKTLAGKEYSKSFQVVR